MDYLTPTTEHPQFVRGMTTPESIYKSDTEDAHQSAIFTWASLPWIQEEFPELEWLHAIANGGSRGDSATSRAIRGAALKRSGVKKGVADLFLPVPVGPWHGLYIEMKKPSVKPKRPRDPDKKPAGVSDEQWDYALFVKSKGYGWMCCYSFDEAVTVLTKYLNYGKVLHEYRNR